METAYGRFMAKPVFGKEPLVSEAKCGDFDFHFIVQAFRKLSSQIPIRVRLSTPVILTSASGYVVDMSI